MRASGYQARILQLAARFDQLGSRSKAEVFLVFSKSILPLLHPEYFTERHWTGIARKIIDATEAALSGRPSDVRALFDEVARELPHSEDLSEADEFYALDAIVVLDATLRFASNNEVPRGEVLEYVLRPMYSYLCERDLGVIDIGSSSVELQWEEGLLGDELMSEALKFLESVIESAEHSVPLLHSQIEALSGRGRALIPPG